MMVLLGMGSCPIHSACFLFSVKGLLTELDVEPDAIGILPLLIPLSILSPVKINLVNSDEELPINRLKNEPVNVPINISTSFLSVKGGWTLLARSLHFWAYTLNPSSLSMVIF